MQYQQCTEPITILTDIQMVDTLLYLTFLAGLVPAALFYGLKPVSCSELNYIRPFIWLTALGSIYEPVATLWLEIPSQPWFRLYNILEFLCLYYFFSKMLGAEYNQVLRTFLTLFLTGALVLYFALDISQLTLEAYYAPFIFVFVTACSVMWLRKVFIAADISLLNSPPFFFVCGFFFYYTNTFLFYLLSDIVIMDYNFDYKAYWVINILATLILKIIISLGVWKGRQTLR
jgi:hypothetical protein